MVLTRYLSACAQILLAGIILLSGCATPLPAGAPARGGLTRRPSSEKITAPIFDSDLQTLVTPPVGWKPDPLKVTDKSRHRVWLSPTGSTAYGVIYFDLPLPVGVDMALWGFLNQMKKTTGEADVISKSADPRLQVVRFVADGGLYRIRCEMKVSGFHGWAVYAGSLRARPENPAELGIAEQARDVTPIGPR